LFLRAQSAQQQRQGRRLFLLSVLGAEATTKFQLATEAAFQCSFVVHTTKVSTPDWPVSRRFIISTSAAGQPVKQIVVRFSKQLSE